MGFWDRLFKRRKKRSFHGANQSRLMNDFLTTTLSSDSEIKGSV